MPGCSSRSAGPRGRPSRAAGARRPRSACPSRAGGLQAAGRYRASRPTAVTMATRATVTLEYDINGGPVQERLQFRLSAADYDRDLNAENARRFRTQMAPFIDHRPRPAGCH